MYATERQQSRQMSDRSQTKASLIAPPIRGGHNDSRRGATSKCTYPGTFTFKRLGNQTAGPSLVVRTPRGRRGRPPRGFECGSNDVCLCLLLVSPGRVPTYRTMYDVRRHHGTLPAARRAREHDFVVYTFFTYIFLAEATCQHDRISCTSGPLGKTRPVSERTLRCPRCNCCWTHVANIGTGSFWSNS